MVDIYWGEDAASSLDYIAPKCVIGLDRDGVINVDKGYVFKVSDFEWVLDAKVAIKFLNEIAG